MKRTLIFIGKNMKSFMLILFGALIVAGWHVVHDPSIQVLINSEFSDPIFSKEFDVLTKGTTISGILQPTHDSTYAFALVYPAPVKSFFVTNHLDGEISYSLSTKGRTLLSGNISSLEDRHALWNMGEKTILLFYIDLPYRYFSRSGDLKLTVTLNEPIQRLAPYNGTIRFEVFPYYVL